MDTRSSWNREAPPPRLGRAHPHVAHAVGLFAALLAPACAALPVVPTANPPLSLDGQRILLLPLQVEPALAELDRAAIDAELLFALNERAPGVQWVPPAELRQVLRRSPAVAGDPDALPLDPLLHHGERRAIEPLAGQLRRYAALTDTRLVLLARAAPGGQPAEYRLLASLLDARTGDVVWRGGAAEPIAHSPDRARLAEAAAALAARLVSPTTPEPEP